MKNKFESLIVGSGQAGKPLATERLFGLFETVK